MVASLGNPDSFKRVDPTKTATKTAEAPKSISVAFEGDEAKVLSVVLTSYCRNVTTLTMSGQLKRSSDIEKGLVIISNILDKLAKTDFELRAEKETANSLGFTF